jgi:hypothetical protein
VGSGVVVDVRAAAWVLVGHGHTLAALAISAPRTCQYRKKATPLDPSPGLGSGVAEMSQPPSF